MKQENIENDIYVNVDMAAVTAKRGDVKLIRFWLYEGLQLQGWAQIPPHSKDDDIIKADMAAGKVTQVPVVDGRIKKVG